MVPKSRFKKLNNLHKMYFSEYETWLRLVIALDKMGLGAKHILCLLNTAQPQALNGFSSFLYESMHYNLIVHTSNPQPGKINTGIVQKINGVLFLLFLKVTFQ